MRHSNASSLIHVRVAASVRNRNRRVRRDNLPPGRMELLDKLTFHQAGANSRLHERKHLYAVSVSRESRVNNMTNGNGDVLVRL